jgi:hypothetical protein
MFARRLAAVVAGALLLGGAIYLRDGDDGGGGDGLTDHQRERAAEVAELQAADAEELRRIAEQGSGYDLAFEPGYEEVPTLVCSDDLGEVCRDLAGLGFDVSAAPPWTTADRARDGGVPGDVWVGPQALLEGSPDDTLEPEPSALAESRVAAVTRRGSGPAEECEGSGTPLSCLVEEADHVTVPDPTVSAAGSAVLVALANEAGGGPDGLAAAMALLSDAQVTASPIAELIDVGVPRGEVALGTDAPAVGLVEDSYGEEDELPPILVRWSRTSDSVPVGFAVDPQHPQADRIRALLRSSTVAYDLQRAGFLSVVEDVYLDEEGPLADRPDSGAPVTFESLEAARTAWRERS